MSQAYFPTTQVTLDVAVGDAVRIISLAKIGRVRSIVNGQFEVRLSGDVNDPTAPCVLVDQADVEKMLAAH